MHPLKGRTFPERRKSRELCTLTCTVCTRVYEYNIDARGGHTRTKCNSCTVNARRPGKKQQAIAYKGGKCEICGYDRCRRSLGFHHLDPAQKDFGIGGRMTSSWEVIKMELDKCILVCANCHGEIHEGLIEVPSNTRS